MRLYSYWILLFTALILLAILPFWFPVCEQTTKRNPVYVPETTKNVIYVTMGGRYAKSRDAVNDLVYTFRKSVPGGHVKIFHNEDQPDDLRAFAGEMDLTLVRCTQLIEPYVITRFYCYLKELRLENGARIGFVDTNDVTFQGNVFELIKDNTVHLVQEPVTFPISKCPWHKRWIAECKSHGPDVFDRIKDNSMICAGTIFGDQGAMVPFLERFTEELRRTGCNDQGMLNVLYYTGQLENVSLWPHERRIVMSMNVAREPTDFADALVVHTGDNSKAVEVVNPVVFKNVLNVYQQALSRKLLTVVDHALGDSYVIDGGTLVGAALDNRRIPWDDDMDIYIMDSDKEKTIEKLKSQGLTVSPSYNGYYLKVWDPRDPKVKNNQKHNWPFIDIGLLVGNKTHVWEKRIKESKYSHHVYKREWIFPASRILYEGIYVRAPRDTKAFLLHRFGPRWAQQDVFANWDHRLEKTRYPKLGNGNFKVIRDRLNNQY